MDGPWVTQYQEDENGETLLDEEGNPIVDYDKFNRYQYNGKELTEDLGLNWNDYGARWYDPAIGRWNTVDPISEDYFSMSPYSYVAGNPINAIDPDGMRIIFINGKIGGGSPSAGAPYWNGPNSAFVRGAQDYFNDYDTPFFTDEDYGYLNDESDRVKQGRAYAKANIGALTNGLNQKKDVFRLITHSMGGAFGEGIKEYLESQGWTVETVLLLNTFESDELGFSEEDRATIIDYKNIDDPVLTIFDSSMGGVPPKGADIKIRVKSGLQDMRYIHRFPIDYPAQFWSALDRLIREALKSEPHNDIPARDSNKGEE